MFDFKNLTFYKTILGVQFGVAYAFSALICMNSKFFKDLPTKVEDLVRNMNLNVFDCIFLSICAGVGEEFLFRAGIQFYLGPIITSVIFVAIHGYLNPFNWKMSLYGIIVLPFILIISFALEEFGIWFCIGAHFSYDLILFLSISEKESNS